MKSNKGMNFIDYLCGMKKRWIYLRPFSRLFFLLLLSAGLVIPTVAAQELSTQNKEKETIFEALLADKPGVGTIIINQSQHIMQLVGKPSSALSNARYIDGYAILSGYRVQLYSGNHSDSKNIARSRAAEVKALFPELDTTIEFEAPFWRLRVGNFTDYSEAREHMQILKDKFTSFSKEIYIVRTPIKIKQ